MFGRHNPARELNRWRRSAEEALGLRDAPGLELLEELEAWVEGLPWVVRLESPDEPSVRRFAVDCPDLGCRSVWVAIIPVDASDGSIEIQVALPGIVAHRGFAVGWGVPIVEIDRGRVVVGVAIPTTTAEFRALESLLGVAYSGAFPTLHA